MSHAKIRPARSSDIGFILKSWVRNYARSPYAGAYPAKRLATAIRDTIRDLMASENVSLAIACNPKDENAIWGFACAQQHPDYAIIHYIYVKPLFRRVGIGSQLAKWAIGEQTEPPRYTFRTKLSRKLLPNAIYKPGIVRAIWNPYP